MLNDSFGRRFSYVRLSLTEDCHFNCRYCLPSKKAGGRSTGLSIQEINHLAQALRDLGIIKVRLTGGEPTLRQDLPEVIETIAAAGIQDIALTTNGYILHKYAQAYKTAGLEYVNISLDSLESSMFKHIRGVDKLPMILKSIDEACRIGFKAVKVNVVLLKGLNEYAFKEFMDFAQERDLSLRFIELMETHLNEAFFHRHHMSAQPLIDFLEARGFEKTDKKETDGPALTFKHPAYKGTIGFITPYAPLFCQGCNRFRISSTGRVAPCLFTDKEHDIRPLLQEAHQKQKLMQTIGFIMSRKKEKHLLHENNKGKRYSFSHIGG